jgi:hypothetical protein
VTRKSIGKDALGNQALPNPFVWYKKLLVMFYRLVITVVSGWCALLGQTLSESPVPAAGERSLRPAGFINQNVMVQGFLDRESGGDRLLTTALVKPGSICGE